MIWPLNKTNSVIYSFLYLSLVFFWIIVEKLTIFGPETGWWHWRQGLAKRASQRWQRSFLSATKGDRHSIHLKKFFILCLPSYTVFFIRERCWRMPQIFIVRLMDSQAYTLLKFNEIKC